MKLSTTLKLAGAFCLSLSLFTFLYSKSITRVNRTQIAKKPATQRVIIYRNLNKMLYMHRKYATKFTNTEKWEMVNIMYRLGEKMYGVNHKLILSIMAVESRYNRYAKNCNAKSKWVKRKRKGKKRWVKVRFCSSIDYGIGQQNNRYWKERVRKAYRTNNKMRLVQKKKMGHSIYNLYSNLIATVQFANFCIKNNKHYSDKVKIECYNKGTVGAKRTNNRNYYYKIIKNYWTI